jgi:hypothetical protein
MIDMIDEYGASRGLGRRTNLSKVIHLRRPVEMCRVDEEFAGLITKALAVAGWSVSEACREAEIPYPALENARLGNRVLSNKYVRALIVALLREQRSEAALMLAGPFLPGGYLIRWKGTRNNLQTWRDEVAAISIVIEQITVSIEDGNVDRYELDTIERAVHVMSGMLLDQVEASREALKQKAADRAQPQPVRIAGARVRATG